MFNFDVSISSLRASQIALDTIANNIANANTPGYSRQQVDLRDRASYPQNGLWIGWGVEAHSIRRVTEWTVESAMTRNISRQSLIGQSRSVLSLVEQRLATGDHSLQKRIEKFFDEIVRLQNDPTDPAGRASLINSATAMTAEFNQLNDYLHSLKRDIVSETEIGVSAVNAGFEELFRINKQIKAARFAGHQPNDLLDRHQTLINELSQWVDITVSTDNSGFKYRIGDMFATTGESPFKIESKVEDGKLLIVTERSNNPLQMKGGRLSAWTQAHNKQIPDLLKRLDQTALNLMGAFDALHTTGLTLAGPRSVIYGKRSVDNTTSPLSQVTGPFATKAGTLHLSITETATGKRTQRAIAFDPTTQSLTDLATAINSLGDVQAIVDPQTQRLVISAHSGYAVDFAGRLPTHADRNLITGNANIEFAGQYTGNQNGQYSFTVIGSGTVGVTNGLQLRVTDASGAVVGDFNIGEGFTPGSKIVLADGVAVKIDSGTLNANDQFSVDLIHNSDTTGTLVALGLGTFFQGSGAGSIAVDASIRSDSGLFASSRDGQAGDGTNLARFAALRSASLMPDGQTLAQFTSATVTHNALELRTLSDEQKDLELLMNQLQNQRQAISGVDPNEQMVQLTRYQRAFEASVRVISVVDQMLAELMSILR